MNATSRGTLRVGARPVQTEAVRKWAVLLVLALLICMAALLASASAQAATPAFNTILGRPTADSVTASIVPDQTGEAYLEYGSSSGLYTTGHTGGFSCVSGEPVEVVMNGLSSDTKYYYRLQFESTGSGEWTAGAEHSFRTQRAPGDTFSFTMVADSHLGQYGGQTDFQKSMYQQTLLNIENEDPDFHIDLGDSSAMDPSPLGTGMTDAEGRAAWYVQRPYLGQICHSIPFFLVLGNHENEEGWNWDDTFAAPDKSLALVGMAARKLYFPNPIPDGFYTGNEDDLPAAFAAATGSPDHEDYYAWTWGDALFVVIDPYHYSMTWPSEGGSYGGEGQDGEPTTGTRWDWTLGRTQYDWLAKTLEDSGAEYKFVFSHQKAGGDNPYGRGGIKSAAYYEWGGKNADGSWGFSTRRPGWGVDSEHPEGTPIHQLMVENGVTAYFHGHDHAYAYEKLDGVVYQECPKPDEAVPVETSYLVESAVNGGDHYPSPAVTLPASGHMRVTVSPTAGVTVDYVRTYLPGDGTNGEIARSYTIPPPGVVTHTLTYAAGAHGSISGVNPQTVVDGRDGTAVEAIPDYRCHFVDWSDGSTANPRTDTAVTADVNVTANFAADYALVTLDGTPTRATGDTTAGSVSFAHTTGSGIDRLLLVGVAWNCSTTDRSITSVTFTPSGGNAIPLTVVKTQQAGTQLRYAAIYKLLDPPKGVTGTVTVSFSGVVGYGSVAGAADFAGVDQRDPLGTAAGAGSTSQGTAPAVPLTGLAGDELVFDSVFMGGTGSTQTLTPSTGQTPRWNTYAPSLCTGASSTRQATGSSVPMSWTAGTSAYWAIAAVPINPRPSAPSYPAVTVTAPGGGSYAQGDPLAVTWTAGPDVTGGEYGVWAEAANGNWYGGDLVAANAAHNHNLTLDMPVGSGYRIAVMYRPLAGAGAWLFPVAYSGSFAVTSPYPAVTVTAPGGGSYAQGDPLAVTWTAGPDVTGGEYGVWAEAANGNWYGGDLVAANAAHNHNLTLDMPVGSGYRIAVMYRPLAGAGAWLFPVAYSGSFAVTSPYPAVTVTAPGGGSYAQGDPLAVTWTAGPDVTGGEYGVWAEAANGNWYGGDLVAANAAHNHNLTLDMPVGTGYRIAVMYRPAAGSGAWVYPVAYSGSFVVN